MNSKIKYLKYPTKLINDAAKEAGVSPEKYVAMTRSFFLGLTVCAHLVGTDGDASVFELRAVKG